MTRQKLFPSFRNVLLWSVRKLKRKVNSRAAKPAGLRDRDRTELLHLWDSGTNRMNGMWGELWRKLYAEFRRRNHPHHLGVQWHQFRAKSSLFWTVATFETYSGSWQKPVCEDLFPCKAAFKQAPWRVSKQADQAESPHGNQRAFWVSS